VPKAVVDIAAVKSRELEVSVSKKKMFTLGRLVSNVLEHEDEAALQRLVLGVSQL
jgi:hypothetical protein